VIFSTKNHATQLGFFERAFLYCSLLWQYPLPVPTIPWRVPIRSLLYVICARAHTQLICINQVVYWQPRKRSLKSSRRKLSQLRGTRPFGGALRKRDIRATDPHRRGKAGRRVHRRRKCCQCILDSTLFIITTLRRAPTSASLPLANVKKITRIHALSPKRALLQFDTDIILSGPNISKVIVLPDAWVIAYKFKPVREGLCSPRRATAFWRHVSAWPQEHGFSRSTLRHQGCPRHAALPHGIRYRPCLCVLSPFMKGGGGATIQSSMATEAPKAEKKLPEFGVIVYNDGVSGVLQTRRTSSPRATELEVARGNAQLCVIREICSYLPPGLQLTLNITMAGLVITYPKCPGSLRIWSPPRVPFGITINNGHTLTISRINEDVVHAVHREWTRKTDVFFMSCELGIYLETGRPSRDIVINRKYADESR
jgi:hypothetical protein